MIDHIIKSSVERPLLIICITILFVMAGWYAFDNLPIDAIPDITNVQVQVITPVPAQIPDTIEKNITYPIENALNSIPGAEEIRSITRYGLSHVTVIFTEGYDLYRARQLVSEQLQTLDLPEGIKPTLGPITTGLGEIYHYSLEAKKWEKNPKKKMEQLMELRTLQEWELKPRLLSVQGVVEVNTIGGYPKQYYIKPKLNKMKEFGLHFHEITEAIGKSSYNTGGSYIQQTAENLLVQGNGLIRSVQDIEKIPVKILQNFTSITIKDVAHVGLDKEIRTGAAVVNGNESIVGSVFMLLGANSRTVSKDVDEKIDEIRSALPSWVVLNTLYDRSDLVDSSLNTVQKNLLFGALLVVFILVLLIGNTRVALITAITIPLSLLGTFLLMKIFNISGSLMSLGAIDFGIVIDGAVIVMDNCARLVNNAALKKGSTLNRWEIKDIVKTSTIEIRKAAGFGQLIIVIVFLPLFALSGVEGKMFKPMAYGFSFALISAFILSFTTIPAIAGMFLSGKPKKDNAYLMKVINSLYLSILHKTIKNRILAIGLAFGTIIISIVIFLMSGSEFIPKLDEGSIAMQFIRPMNISSENSIKLEKISQKIILSFPEVERTFSRLGTAEITVDPAGINHADTYIILKPESKWPKIAGKKRTKDQLAKEINNTLLKAVPGQRIMVSQPIELKFNELLEGVRSDVSMKIFGPDMEILEKYGKEAVALIRKIPGSGEVEPEIKGKSPLMIITPRMESINKYGISKWNVLDAITIALGGQEAGFLYEGVRKYPIVVRLSDYARKDLSIIRNLPIGITNDLTVPLKEIASISIEDIYNSISRESSKRRTAVMINIDDRDTDSFVKDAKKVIKEKLALPQGYYIDWGGNFENLLSAKERLEYIVPITLLVVLFMIYSAFGNILQTFLIFLGIPFAVVGGVFSLKLMGLDFSISAGVGFIALSGIAVLNGVVLVSYFNSLKAQGETGIDLIEKGTMVRLRPVMMTALTDILGFLPMMLATGTGAEVQKPLATVVVGGVITSTALTLLILPILYNMLENRMGYFKESNH